MTMSSTFVRRANLLALICGFYAADSHAQTDGRQAPTRFRNAPAPAPGLTPRLLYPGGYQSPQRFASLRQEPTVGVPAPGTPAPGTPAPTTPAPSGPLTEPVSPGGSGGTAN